MRANEQALRPAPFQPTFPADDMALIHDPALRPKPTFLPPAVWEKIEHEFILGLGSTRTLAAKHNVKLSTLQARCKREDWVALRDERAQGELDEVIGLSRMINFEEAP